METLKSKKTKIWMLVVILLMQVILPTLTVMLENGTTIISLAATTEWDISAQEDGSMKAIFDEETGTLTIAGSGMMPDDYKPWVSVKEQTEKIIIEEGITSIGFDAFSACKNLTEVKIAESVKSIGDSAFAFCEKLEVIEIPNSVETIGEGAFRGCKFLTNITLPNNITSINDETFVLCERLETIEIPSSVETIGKSAFYACYLLNNLVLPEGIISIGDSAFASCNELEGIEIPSSVTNIGSNVFSDCKSLTSINIPASVEVIGTNTFSLCSNLANIFVDETNANYSSGDGVLFNKDKTSLIIYPEGKQVEEYTIPSTVTTIESQAFYNNFTLTSINVPAVVTEIKDKAFYCNSNLINITVDEANENYISENGVLYNKDKTTLINYPARKTETEFTVPSTVTTIKNYAFNGCGYLTNIAIPEGLQTMEEGCFYGCVSLTEIQLPRELTTIAKKAFYGCKGLESIDIPKGVTTIEDFAFSHCENLTSITISDGVSSIGYSSFMGCTILTNIMLPESLTNIGPDAFNGCTNLVSAVIPSSVTVIGGFAFNGCENLTIYCKTGSYAEEYASTNELACVIDDEAPVIESVVAVEELEGTTVTVTAIDDKAGLANSAYSFDDGATWQNENTYTGDIANLKIKLKDALGNIAIYEGEIIITKTEWNISADEEQSVKATFETETGSLTISGTGAMLDWTLEATAPWEAIKDKITSIKIEQGVTNIGSRAFAGFSALTSIEIPEGITSIGEYAFSECASLTNITIPEGVTAIQSSTFANCGNLETITLPSNITTIGDNVFVNCEKLASIQIPEGVTTIGDSAFQKCSALTSIEIPQATATIGSKVFYDCVNLSTINVNENNEIYSSEAGVLYSKDKAVLIVYPAGRTETNFNISKEVTTIAAEAFALCKNLTSLEIPETVTVIEENALYGCDAITIYCMNNSYARDYAKTNRLLYKIFLPINLNTTKADLQNIIGNVAVMEIYKNGTEITEDTAILGTGMTVTTIMVNTLESYIITIKGDANGDGKADIQDILSINKHRLNKTKLSEGYLKAAEVTGDGNVDIMDILQINKYRLGKINEL